MSEDFLKDLQYKQMIQHLKAMSSTEISKHLKAYGCSLTYDDIYEKLKTTYNDLLIADIIFESDTICDKGMPYPKSFIDEAVFEIASREVFEFTHYGLISSTIATLAAKPEKNDEVFDKIEEQFRKLFKTAKRFRVHSFDTMVYQINDGVDMMGILVDILNTWMEQGRAQNHYYKRIIDFVEKFLVVFPKTNDFSKVTLQYELAQAYLGMKSKKGEQLFLQLLKTHSDPTDVVFHYALAYLDDDEPRAMRILQRYQPILDKRSESYAFIQELKQDFQKR